MMRVVAKGWMRVVAAVGMACVIPLALWLFAVGRLAAAGVFEIRTRLTTRAANGCQSWPQSARS